MADVQFQSDLTIAGSHLKPKNGYGQNGFPGASSDLPGKHTTSGFLPTVAVPDDNWQTRKVSAEPLAPSYGMKSRGAPQAIPTANVRKAHVAVNPKSFQR